MMGFLQVNGIISTYSSMWTTSWWISVYQNRLFRTLARYNGAINIIKWVLHVVQLSYTLDH